MIKEASATSKRDPTAVVTIISIKVNPADLWPSALSLINISLNPKLRDEGAHFPPPNDVARLPSHLHVHASQAVAVALRDGHAGNLQGAGINQTAVGRVGHREVGGDEGGVI